MKVSKLKYCLTCGIRNKPSVLILSLFAFSLSFGRQFSTYILALLLINLLWIFLKDKKKWTAFKPSAYLSQFVLLFLCFALPALAYDGFKFKIIEGKLSLLLIPLLLCVNYKTFNADTRLIVLKWFILGNIISAIACLCIATFHSLKLEEGSFVFDSSVWGNTPFLYSINHYGNYYFSEHFSFFNHPSYWGVSILFSIGILIHDRIKYQIFSSRRNLVILLFFFLLLVLLSSRLVLLLLILLLLPYFIYRFRNTSLRYKLLVLLIIGSVIGMSFFHPRIRSTIDSVATNGFSEEQRSLLWRGSIDMLKMQPLTGFGPEGANLLVHRYEQMKAESNGEERLNAHNQFLEIWIYAGLTGFLVLLAVFYLGFYSAITRNDKIYLLFLVIYLSFFLVESVFERFQGISQFTFFNTLLFLSKDSHNKGL